MNNQTRWSVLLLFAILAWIPCASAQATDPAQTPAQGDSQAKEKTDDDEPGKGKISEFGESLAKFWSVSSAFQATQSFDDNVFMANSFRKSDTVSKLSGRMTVAYRGQHTRFEASYLPEFNIYQRYDPLNYATHSYMHTLTHDFTRRYEMHWRANLFQAPSRGNLPFKSINFGGLRFNTYSLEALNEGLNLLNASNVIGASYRWTPRLKVFSDLEGAATHFSERGSPVVSPVSNDLTYSVGGKVGLDYSLNAQQSIGVTVGNTYFASIAAPAATGVRNTHQHYQTVFVTYNHKLPNRFVLYAAAGPGITERSGSPDANIGVFFDVGVSRHLVRSGFALTFQRTTQVGLLQESLTGYTVSGQANRDFGRKWVTNIGAAYLRSEGSSGLHQMESASGHARIGYRFNSHLTPFINYGYLHQKALIFSPSIRNVNRNEIALGFVYNFGVVAGR